MNLKNAAGHFKTITRHRHLVIKHCIRAGIPVQGFLHDLSKYSYAEFSMGVKYYFGNKSPNEGERAEYGYSLAWMHHKGRNRHHFEYWTDYNPHTKKVEAVKMPVKYVKEMFCDRVAASKVYQGKNYVDSHPLSYFKNAKTTRFIHPETSELLEKMLTVLAERGEKAAFEYVKSVKKY